MKSITGIIPIQLLQVCCLKTGRFKEFVVLNHHTYTADVHKGKNESLAWSKEYSALSDYQIPDLSPAALAQMVQDWTENKSLESFNNYFRNKYHHNLKAECDQQCREQIVCLVTNAAKLSNLDPDFCGEVPV